MDKLITLRLTPEQAMKLLNLMSREKINLYLSTQPNLSAMSLKEVEELIILLSEAFTR